MAHNGGDDLCLFLESAAQRLSPTLIITRPQVPRQKGIAFGAGRVDDDVREALENPPAAGSADGSNWDLGASPRLIHGFPEAP